MPTKILIADDHELTIVGIRKTLEADPYFRIVAEAKNGREAITLTREFSPDIVILDICMPELNGFDTAEQILLEMPNTKIVFLSMHSDKRYVEKALKTGASGYILKDCIACEILDALRTVVHGHCYLSPEITGVVIDYIRFQDKQEKSERSQDALTYREREVLQLIAEGKTSKEIADLIHISLKTVEARRKRIMEKLDIHTIAQLTKYAIREGLTSLEQ